MVPSARFVLVGDGPEASAVEAALQDTGLAGHVRWVRRGVGHELLAAVDVLLVTSHYEGFSYVMLEALDSGCAIVTTPVGGARDCVVGGRNGTIVTSSTADALARAVQPFVESNERRETARVVSRARARDFEIDRMVDRLVTLYRGAVDDAA